MSTFLGLFGYTAVDQALEARVANLESSVSSQAVVIDSQQDEIESLHRLGKYDTKINQENFESDSHTAYNTPLPYTESSTSVNYWKGKIFVLNSKAKTKYMYHLYENGYAEYVNTGFSYQSNIRANWEKPAIYGADREYEDNEHATVTDANETIAPTDNRISTTSREYTYALVTRPVPEGTYKDYFLYLDSSELKVIDGTETKENYSYYDDNYSVCTTNIYKYGYSLQLKVTGHADKALAGKRLRINCIAYLLGDDSEEINSLISTVTIDTNGNFETTIVGQLNSENMLNSIEKYGYAPWLSIIN